MRWIPWIGFLTLALGLALGCTAHKAGERNGLRSGTKSLDGAQWWVRLELEGASAAGSYRLRIREFSQGVREMALFSTLGGSVLVIAQFPEGWQVQGRGLSGPCRFSSWKCWGAVGRGLLPFAELEAFWRGSEPRCQLEGVGFLRRWAWARSARDHSGRTWIPLDNSLQGEIRLVPPGSEGELRHAVTGWRLRWKTVERSTLPGGSPLPGPWDATLPECSLADLP